MGRTKQTARKSVGGNAPGRHGPKVANRSAMGQAAAASGGGGYKSDSSLSSARSLEPPAVNPSKTTALSSQVVKADADSSVDEPLSNLAASFARQVQREQMVDSGYAVMPPQSTSTIGQSQDDRQESTEEEVTASAGTVDMTPENLDNREAGNESSLSGPPSDLSGDISDDLACDDEAYDDIIDRSINHKTKHVVQVGEALLSANTWKVPTAPMDSAGDWLAAQVSVGYVDFKTGPGELYDSSRTLFGDMHPLYVSAVVPLQANALATGFACSLQLLPRSRSEDENVGDEITQTLIVKVTIWAAPDSAGSVRSELEEKGVRLGPNASGTESQTPEANQQGHSALVTLASEFQTDAKAQRADYRVEHQEDFELGHPSKAQSLAVAAEEMDEKQQQCEPLAGLGEEHDRSAPIFQQTPIPFEAPQGEVSEDQNVALGKMASDVSPAADPSQDVKMLDVSYAAAALDSEACGDQPVPPNKPVPGSSEGEHESTASNATIRRVTSPPAQHVAIDKGAVSKSAFLSLPPREHIQALVNGIDRRVQARLDQHQFPLAPPMTTPLPSSDLVEAQAETTSVPQLASFKQESTPSLEVPAEPQQQVANATHPVHELEQEDVNIFQQFTGTSEDVARQYLISGGSLRQAMKTFHKDEQALKTARKSVVKPPTLLEETLKSPDVVKSKRQEQHRTGDAVVIFDGMDLSKRCRLSSLDLSDSLLALESEAAPSDEEPADVQGVRYLYILLQPRNGELPRLQRKSLLTMRDDCKDEMYSENMDHAIAGIDHEDGIDEVGNQSDTTVTNNIKIENEELLVTELQKHAEKSPSPSPTEAIDWQTGYEDFFYILPRRKPKYANPSAKLDSIMSRLEAVAQIANYYEAVDHDAAVTESMTNLFNKFEIKHQLWEAVAKDAARWLRLAIHLKQNHVFKEAFVHVAGCYPDWPWSVPQSDLPISLQHSIEIKSCQLTAQRDKINWKLMLATISCLQDPDDSSSPVLPASPTFNSTTWIVVNIWRDWISNHIAALQDEAGTRPLPSELCTHPEDGECLTVAGFYRQIYEGNATYLPLAAVLHNWNDADFKHDVRRFKTANDCRELVRINLQTLKDEASELVKPLAQVNLQFKGKLDYLSCIEVEEGDRPWEEEVEIETDG